MIDRRGAGAITPIAELIWRIADDYVKLHISKELLGIVGMDEHIGILLCLRAAVVHLLGCAAEFALAVFPGVGAVGIENIAALSTETGYAVFPIGVLAAVYGAP